jgi:adhesin/invasin
VEAGGPAAKKAPADYRLYNKLLSLAGIPGFLPEGDDGEASQAGAGLAGRRRQPQVADRYRRNPDGSYGPQSSTAINFDGPGLEAKILGMALSAGNQAFNSWSEGWLSGFGRAKVAVNFSSDGFVTGSIDFLSPIYDAQGFTVFSQFGLRTLPGERIIGNMGLGHRLFWDDWAFGYNAFLDQDFTRGHSRGGVGVELWYDWLRLGANYYKPLSKWMPSKDFDPRFIQERPAEGWDVRLTGYLPFYRHLALNVAMEQWYGQYVAVFGNNDRLAAAPKAWTLGLAWTPVPLVSVTGEARSSNRHREARLGLSLNYQFGVPLQQQLEPATVTEMATIDGSRHDFVQRQNEMILEYRATPGRYRIRFRSIGNNNYVLTVTDGFGNVVSGLPVNIFT